MSDKAKAENALIRQAAKDLSGLGYTPAQLAIILPTLPRRTLFRDLAAVRADVAMADLSDWTGNAAVATNANAMRRILPRSPRP
jgi:hypothetical protein